MLEQHFLVHPGKLAALVRAAQITPTSRVLELGAGSGTVAGVLPPCHLTLVELDTGLALQLGQRFPQATVLNEDALKALHCLEFDVLLSNLPADLTEGVLEHLQTKRFRRALVAVHAEYEFTVPGTLMLEPLLTLDESDFAPPQPFKSKLIVVTPRLCP